LFHIVGSFLTFTFHKVVYRGVMKSLTITSLHNHCWIRGWKKFEKRSTLDEVMDN